MNGEQLPQADGPLVRLSLYDGQTIYAVVRGRQCERDGSWWFALQIHLPSSVTDDRGRMNDAPAPVDFLAPASRCTPVDGQHYDAVPTVRHDILPAWVIEKVWPPPDEGPSLVAHRGDCRAGTGPFRPATTYQARAALGGGAAACTTCRPDRPLREYGG